MKSTGFHSLLGMVLWNNYALQLQPKPFLISLLYFSCSILSKRSIFLLPFMRVPIPSQYWDMRVPAFIFHRLFLIKETLIIFLPHWSIFSRFTIFSPLWFPHLSLPTLQNTLIQDQFSLLMCNLVESQFYFPFLIWVVVIQHSFF